MPGGYNIPRLKGKLNAAKSQFNDMPITAMPGGSLAGARTKIAEDEATACIEEMREALLSIPGLGLISATPGNPVTGTSITGTAT